MIDHSGSSDFWPEDGYSHALLDATLHRARNCHSADPLRWNPAEKPEGEEWLVAADPTEMQYPPLQEMKQKSRFFFVLETPSGKSRYKLGGCYLANTNEVLYQILYKDQLWRLQKRKDPKSPLFEDLYTNTQDNDVDPDAPPQLGWHSVLQQGGPQVLNLKFFSFAKWRTCAKFLPALPQPWSNVRECRVEVHKTAKDFARDLTRYFVIDYGKVRAYFKRLDVYDVIYENDQGAVIGVGAPNEYHVHRVWNTCLTGIFHRQANTYNCSQELIAARKKLKKANSENVQNFFASLVAHPGDIDALVRDGLSLDRLDFFWDNVRYDKRRREWVLNLFLHVEWCMWAEEKMGDEHQCHVRRKLLYQIQQWLNGIWDQQVRPSGEASKLLEMIRVSTLLEDEACALKTLHEKQAPVGTRFFDRVNTDFQPLRIFPPPSPPNDEDVRRATLFSTSEMPATDLPPPTQELPSTILARPNTPLPPVCSTNLTPHKPPPLPPSDDVCSELLRPAGTIRPAGTTSAPSRRNSPPMPPSNDVEDDENAASEDDIDMSPNMPLSAAKASASPVSSGEILPPKPPPTKPKKPPPPKAPIQCSALAQRSNASETSVPKTSTSEKDPSAQAPRSGATGTCVPKSSTSGKDSSGQAPPPSVLPRKAPPMRSQQPPQQAKAVMPLSVGPPPASVLHSDHVQYPPPPPKHPSAVGKATPTPGMLDPTSAPPPQTARPEHLPPSQSSIGMVVYDQGIPLPPPKDSIGSMVTVSGQSGNSLALSGPSGKVTGEFHPEQSSKNASPPPRDSSSAPPPVAGVSNSAPRPPGGQVCGAPNRPPPVRSPSLPMECSSIRGIPASLPTVRTHPPPPPQTDRPRPPPLMQSGSSAMPAHGPEIRPSPPGQSSSQPLSQPAQSSSSVVHPPPALDCYAPPPPPGQSSCAPHPSPALGCYAPTPSPHQTSSVNVVGAQPRAVLPPVQGIDCAPPHLHPRPPPSPPVRGPQPPLLAQPHPIPVSSPAQLCRPEHIQNLGAVTPKAPAPPRSGTLSSPAVAEIPLRPTATQAVPHSARSPPPPPLSARPPPPPALPPTLPYAPQAPNAVCSTAGSTAPTTPESCRSVRPTRAQLNFNQCADAKTPFNASFPCFSSGSLVAMNTVPVVPPVYHEYNQQQNQFAQHSREQQYQLQHQHRPQHQPQQHPQQYPQQQYQQQPQQLRPPQQQQQHIHHQQQQPLQPHLQSHQYQHPSQQLPPPQQPQQSLQPQPPQTDDHIDEDATNILFPSDAQWCAFPLTMRDMLLRNKLYRGKKEHYADAFAHFMGLEAPTPHGNVHQEANHTDHTPFPSDDEWRALPLTVRHAWLKKLYLPVVAHYQTVFDHFMRLNEHTPREHVRQEPNHPPLPSD
eukprot:GEMP01001325.1.p1 GENE.GEMP01001325.1~~GEMP01001325.1.p1  ORF type:complete len:1376 (+),score=353.26 GEMP01001325.1:538-4665(+)